MIWIHGCLLSLLVLCGFSIVNKLLQYIVIAKIANKSGEYNIGFEVIMFALIIPYLVYG